MDGHLDSHTAPELSHRLKRDKNTKLNLTQLFQCQGELTSTEAMIKTMRKRGKGRMSDFIDDFILLRCTCTIWCLHHPNQDPDVAFVLRKSILTLAKFIIKAKITCALVRPPPPLLTPLALAPPPPPPTTLSHMYCENCEILLYFIIKNKKNKNVYPA